MLACKLALHKPSEFSSLSIWSFDFCNGERLIGNIGICDPVNLGNEY